jgi:hypothetical protein
MNPRGDSAPPWLSALVTPVPVAEFLSKYWLQQHLFCRGSAERFSELLSWTAINRILEHHWREHYRFRLASQGHDLEPSSYADLDGHTPRIRARDVTDHLRRGATLSFHGIDEVHEPLTRLAESFEAFFQASTKINLYAGWRALHGLDLHRDDQDVLILQLDGPKRWLVYGFSVEGVDRNQLENRSAPPAGALLDQILRPGDLLYIPRGCYHLAVPMNEPTLHVTVSVKTETHATPRPSFSLPWAATSELLPPDRSFFVRMNVPSQLVIHKNADAEPGEWRCGGRRYRFPRSMQWIIEHLGDGGPLPFGGLIEAVGGRLDEGMVRMLVGMLVKEGLVTISV